MSTRTLKDPNRLTAELASTITYLESPGSMESLGSLSINWRERTLSGGAEELVKVLLSQELIEGEGPSYDLTKAGLSFLGRLLIDVESIGEWSAPFLGKFKMEREIASGKNSVTFKVVHTVLNRAFVLKVIRPGSGEQLEEALKVLAKVPDSDLLVRPHDYFELPFTSITGADINLKCLVFEYIDAPTLDEFLSGRPPLSPFFLLALIEQISRALAGLEQIGAYHGDLHAGNILVKCPAQGRIQFFIIDLSFGLGTTSDLTMRSAKTDFGHFKLHLMRCLEIYQRSLIGISLQKHLGARIFSLVDFILTGEELTFSAVVREIEESTKWERFKEQRERFIAEKFGKPRDFQLLRYEEFSDPTVAVELFEPFPELFQKVRRFGNCLLYGHRGSGKSTYLAALACFPGARRPIVDFRENFGVFFACRQGEFRHFSSDVIAFDAQRYRTLKHIIVLKIMRQAIGTLAEAVNKDILAEPEAVEKLYDLLERRACYQKLGAYDTNLIGALENLYSVLLRLEVREIKMFFRGEGTGQEILLAEKDLAEFFEVVGGTFSDLSGTRFLVLFDDAGEPNVPVQAQRCINDLVRGSNPSYCIKLSAERYAYTFEDSMGRALEEFHDMAVYDISKELFLGSGANPARDRVEAHFREILVRRLRSAGYRSSDICAYLGEEPVRIADLVERLSRGRRNAYYCGWSVVWQVADRTVRNLLEIVNSIFDTANIRPESEPRVISPRLQNGAVVSVSERKLKSLSYVPGTLDIYGLEVPLGRRLYEFAAAFGAVAQAYLKRRLGQSTKRRFDERIAIERNDSFPLHPEAENFLRLLVRFGILDDSHFGFARDDTFKKPLYVFARIFCPAFKISFRRDQHLRLSARRFEEFLLEPLRFAGTGTQYLTRNPAPLENYELFADEE